MHFCGHVGHVQLNIYYCVLFSGTVMIEISFTVRLVSGYARVFMVRSVVTVTLPVETRRWNMQEWRLYGKPKCTAQCVHYVRECRYLRVLRPVRIRAAHYR